MSCCCLAYPGRHTAAARAAARSQRVPSSARWHADSFAAECRTTPATPGRELLPGASHTPQRPPAAPASCAPAPSPACPPCWRARPLAAARALARRWHPLLLARPTQTSPASCAHTQAPGPALTASCLWPCACAAAPCPRQHLVMLQQQATAQRHQAAPAEPPLPLTPCRPRLPPEQRRRVQHQLRRQQALCLAACWRQLLPPSAGGRPAP